MSSIHHAHLRASPSHVKKHSAKAARSAPLPKGAARVSLKAHTRKSSKEEDEALASEREEEDDNNMASTFLQYCAMCEKQIVVPNSSILFCSESCRRKDSVQSQSSSSYPTHAHHTLSLRLKEDPSDPRTIKARGVAPRPLPFSQIISAARIPSLDHDGKQDLDPTEWKPAERKLGSWKPKLTHRPSSEAFEYLSKFHRSSPTLNEGRRLQVRVRSSASVALTAPSLSHTPSANSSSEESLAGTPYEFVTPPFVARAGAAYSDSSAENSLEMRTPMAAVLAAPEAGGKPEKAIEKGCATSGSVALGNLSYEKKNVGGTSGPAAGSLQKLLGTSKVKA